MMRLVVVPVLLMLFLLVALPRAAQAEPILQIYIEGGTYESATESWVTSDSTFTLWVVGNTGWNGTIVDVRLALAYDATETLGVTFSPTSTAGLGGFTDPTVATAPSYIQTVTDGSSPVLGDGSSLPAHDVYGAGTHWLEFALGDFTLTDSPIADFGGSFPSPGAADSAQINAYEITLSGATSVHFDVYNHVIGEHNAWFRFAPFSHDGGGTPVPEPASLALFGLGLAGVALRRRTKRPAS